MNIALDVSPLSTGHSGRGVGVYTRLLLESLRKYEPEHTYMYITNRETIPREADIVHYPYFDPFMLTLPLIKLKPVVVTVHDIIPIVFPDKFPRGIRGGLRWKIQKQSLLLSKRIITDSFASKKDITKRIGYPEDSIDAIYLASSFQGSPDSHRINSAAYLKKAGIPKNFILYVGDVNWNKNVEGLIQGLSEVRRHYPDIALVCVGKSFIDATISETARITELIHSLGMGKNIIMTGFAEEAELAALYKSAICLVSPSYYEGFGFPVVDALTLGCPAVVSETSSLSEIAGPSFRVDATQTSSIASGIMAVLRLTVTQRKKHIESGFTWVSRFSWKKTARETVAAYRKALQ